MRNFKRKLEQKGRLFLESETANISDTYNKETGIGEFDNHGTWWKQEGQKETPSLLTNELV